DQLTETYGPNTDSALRRGAGTDRFIGAWRIAEPAAGGAGTHPPPPLPAVARSARVLNLSNGEGVPASPRLPDGPAEVTLRVEIPPEIDKVQAASLALAGRWRAATRAALTWGLRHGYRVAGFYRGGGAARAYYGLRRARPTRGA